MNDTILNLSVIAAAFIAILASAVDTIPADKMVVAQAPRVVEMQKTVVAAKRHCSALLAENKPEKNAGVRVLHVESSRMERSDSCMLARDRTLENFRSRSCCEPTRRLPARAIRSCQLI